MAMTAFRTQPYVPLEVFLEMEPEPGTWLEWSDGIVHAMSGGRPAHSRLCARIVTFFGSRADRSCTVFDSKVDIWVEAAQFYGQADVSIVCGALHTHVVTRNGKVLGEAITNPELIVEVLSPSTEARDRGEKFAAYKQATSLKEYVLVSQAERRDDPKRIEVRRREEHGWSIDVAETGGTIRIHGSEVPVDEIYG